MQTTSFELERNSFGQLVLSIEDQVYVGVIPVRAFPIQTPEQGIAMVCTDGREVAWIDQLSEVSEQLRELVVDELAGREFVPEIAQIISVSSYSTPCTWTVQTDRGVANFVLRGEEDIRRISGDSLLITDTHGINFLIRQPALLDKHGRKIIDRFL